MAHSGQLSQRHAANGGPTDWQNLSQKLQFGQSLYDGTAKVAARMRVVSISLMIFCISRSFLEDEHTPCGSPWQMTGDSGGRPLDIS
jgi:hypothetical protein